MSFNIDNGSTETLSVEDVLRSCDIPPSEIKITYIDPTTPEWSTTVGSIPVKWYNLSKEGVRFFKILQDFAVSDSTTTLKEACGSIYRALPSEEDFSTEVWRFGEYCLDLAEQIHPSHPSQLRLVSLLHYLKTIRTFGRLHQGQGQDGPSYFLSYQRLGESVVDRLSSYSPDYENPYEFVNLMGFIAKLSDYQVLNGGSNWGAELLSRAHEQPSGYRTKDIPHEALVLAAAQWILWYGRKIFTTLTLGYPLESKHVNMATCKARQYYILKKWHLWRDGFRKMAVADHKKSWDSQREKGSKESSIEEKSLDGRTLNEDDGQSHDKNKKDTEIVINFAELDKLAEECRNVSGIVADLMDSIEKAHSI